MGYEGTAAKKRPRTFDELAGQEFVVSTLKNAIADGRIAHAYLFAGPRGVGKTSAARILAKSLNCETGPTETPCGVCDSCRSIASGSSLDVIEIDGASNTSVNDVRQIRDEVLFPPNASRYKIYIIDEVHMLSGSAFNALLKTIEEPPEYVIFVFATTEVHKVPATIRSRCQQFFFRLIPQTVITSHLAQAVKELELEADEEALIWIAREATGSLRDAYTLFDQVVSFSEDYITLEKIRQKLGLVGFEQMQSLEGYLARRDVQSAVSTVDEVLASGVSVEQFLKDLAEYFRGLLFVKRGIVNRHLLGAEPERLEGELLQALSEFQLETAMELILELFRRIRYSLNQRFELELLVGRIAGLQDYIAPSEILQRLEELERGGGVKPAAESPASGKGDPAAVPAGNAAAGAASGEAAGSGKPAGSDEAGQQPAAQPKTVSSTEVIEAVLEALKRKPTLVSALKGADRFTLENDTLVIVLADSYTAHTVKEEKQAILKAAGDRAGRPLDISVSMKKQEAARSKADDAEVEMVKNVFRGQVIQDGEA